MRNRGHSCYLAAQEGSVILEKCCEAGFESFVISERTPKFLPSILRLTSWLRRIRPDVVNTHSSKDGWIGGIAARLASVPILIRSRHIEVDYPNRWRSRIAFGRLPDHVLTTSERIRSRLIEELSLDPGQITCAPTGIDPAPFQRDLPSLRPEWVGDSRVPVVGMVSVLRSWKGHRILLDALVRLRDQGHPLHLVIAGDGPISAALRKWISERGLTERVTLLGHREDVPAILKSFDLLVAPSTGHEGIPQIILQAHAAACPVVASRVGGIPEVVEDGITGRLVKAGDPEVLAEAITEALHDHDRSVTMARTAQGEVSQRFTLEALCQQLETLYPSLEPLRE